MTTPARLEILSLLSGMSLTDAIEETKNLESTLCLARRGMEAQRILLRFAYVDPANQQHIPGCSVGPAPRMRG